MVFYFLPPDEHVIQKTITLGKNLSSMCSSSLPNRHGVIHVLKYVLLLPR